jgi:hypothetical protein
LIGWALDKWHNWHAVLMLTVAANMAAAFLWLAANRPGAVKPANETY